MFQNQTECNSIIIGGNTYKIDTEYYIPDDTGLNSNNYLRLTSLSYAKIYGTGTSEIYPKYIFNVIIVEYNSFDSGVVNIYKLKIKKRISIII